VKQRIANKLRHKLISDLFLTVQRPLIAIGLALAVSALLIFITGANPLIAYLALAKGSFGSVSAFTNTLVRAAPLLLGGLGFALAHRAGLVNVGIEGQMYAGAAAATVIGVLPLQIPAWVHLTLAVFAGLLGGMIWAAIPGYLRAARGTSEVVVTLMFNYIGIYFISWLVTTPAPLADKVAFFPMSPPIVDGAKLPRLIPGTTLHAGIILGIVLAVLLYFVMRFTPFGFATRMVGSNPDAARYAGIRVPVQHFIVLLISGGFGGLAGMGEVLGLKLRLFDSFAGGVGYEAIAVALLANNSPAGVIFSAIFFGALKAGASKMQVVAGIETSIVLVIQALALAFILALGFSDRRRLRKQAKSEHS